MINAVLTWFKKWQFILMLSFYFISLSTVAWKTYWWTIESVELKQTKKELKIVEQRNEIANNRPDTDEFFDGLLNDPNW